MTATTTRTTRPHYAAAALGATYDAATDAERAARSAADAMRTAARMLADAAERSGDYCAERIAAAAQDAAEHADAAADVAAVTYAAVSTSGRIDALRALGALVGAATRSAQAAVALADRCGVTYGAALADGYACGYDPTAYGVTADAQRVIAAAVDAVRIADVRTTACARVIAAALR